MRCGKCGKDNREGRRFCAECGAPLGMKCARCGASNEPDEKFCGECGIALSASPRPPAVESQPVQAVRFAREDSGAQPPEGERKTITALFADIRGSMELMEDLDPEEARAIVDPALRLMIDAVHRYGGYIVQSTGDGIFALFGAPVAHEDHPQRALYAALRMQEDLKRYSDRLRMEGKLPLQARVGVNTGEAVVRSIKTGAGHAEYTPIGHSTSLAARMQTLAPVGSVAVTDATQKLCEGYFTFKALGPATVKGVSEPVNVFEVTGLGALRTRLQVAARRGLTRFVGRQSELEQMRRALYLAQESHGQLVAAIAEAGVGKSRLFHEFKAMSQSGWMVLEAFSVSHGKASAFLPVIDLLRNYFRIANEDDERARREKVAGKIAILDRALEDTLPYLYSLLGIVEGADPLAQMDGQIKKKRTLEAIKRIALRESLKQPLMVIFEDLHWTDAESLGLLNLLADAIANAHVLMLVNYRPEFTHSWGNKTYYTQLRLDPLGKENAQEMLAALLTSPAPVDKPAGANRESLLADIQVGERVRMHGGLEELTHLIIEKTEGNPFFMEEMVQNLFEEGALTRNGEVKLARPLSAIRIPPMVQAVLAARIDRLAPEEKDLLRTLAVLGKQFTLSEVKATAASQHPRPRVTALAEKGTSAAPLALSRNEAGEGQEEVERMLSDLQLAEFVYEQPAAGDIEYTFKHALTQEVAYNSMLVERRKQIHERAAQAIESLFAASLADHYDDLARHYQRSANAPKAVNYLRLAAQQAMNRSAYTEASAQLTAALELLRTQPEGIERDRTELAARLGLANCIYMSASGGNFLSAVVDMFERARELSERVGDDAGRFEVLEALANICMNRLEQQRARALSEELLTIALRTDDPEMLGRARGRLGVSSLLAGNFVAAAKEWDQADKLSEGGSSKREAAVWNWRIQGRSAASWNLWFLGFPERATVRGRESLAVAREKTATPADLTVALLWSATLYLWLRDPETVYSHAEEAGRLAHEYGFSSQPSGLWRGWALAQQGQIEEGLLEVLQHRAYLMQTAGTITVPWLLAGLADVYLAAGRPREGLEVVAEGLELGQRTGGKYLEAELLRLKGELLLLGNHSATAEAAQCFREAIEVARRQGAKSFELRATMSLARLLVKQGGRAEARAMLAEIYGWFTEGFDTADLKDARALLDELTA